MAAPYEPETIEILEKIEGLPSGAEPSMLLMNPQYIVHKREFFKRLMLNYKGALLTLLSEIPFSKFPGTQTPPAVIVGGAAVALLCGYEFDTPDIDVELSSLAVPVEALYTNGRLHPQYMEYMNFIYEQIRSLLPHYLASFEDLQPITHEDARRDSELSHEVRGDSFGTVYISQIVGLEFATYGPRGRTIEYHSKIVLMVKADGNVERIMEFKMPSVNQKESVTNFLQFDDSLFVSSVPKLLNENLNVMRQKIEKMRRAMGEYDFNIHEMLETDDPSYGLKKEEHLRHAILNYKVRILRHIFRIQQLLHKMAVDRDSYLTTFLPLYTQTIARYLGVPLIREQFRHINFGEYQPVANSLFRSFQPNAPRSNAWKFVLNEAGRLKLRMILRELVTTAKQIKEVENYNKSWKEVKKGVKALPLSMESRSSSPAFSNDDEEDVPFNLKAIENESQRARELLAKPVDVVHEELKKKHKKKKVAPVTLEKIDPEKPFSKYYIYNNVPSVNENILESLHEVIQVNHPGKTTFIYSLFPTRPMVRPQLKNFKLIEESSIFYILNHFVYDLIPKLFSFTLTGNYSIDKTRLLEVYDAMALYLDIMSRGDDEFHEVKMIQLTNFRAAQLKLLSMNHGKEKEREVVVNFWRSCATFTRDSLVRAYIVIAGQQPDIKLLHEFFTKRIRNYPIPELELHSFILDQKIYFMRIYINKLVRNLIGSYNKDAANYAPPVVFIPYGTDFIEIESLLANMVVVFKSKTIMPFNDTLVTTKEYLQGGTITENITDGLIKIELLLLYGRPYWTQDNFKKLFNTYIEADILLVLNDTPFIKDIVEYSKKNKGSIISYIDTTVQLKLLTVLQARYSLPILIPIPVVPLFSSESDEEFARKQNEFAIEKIELQHERNAAKREKEAAVAAEAAAAANRNAKGRELQGAILELEDDVEKGAAAVAEMKKKKGAKSPETKAATEALALAKKTLKEKEAELAKLIKKGGATRKRQRRRFTRKA
jgi:hypothetical protein